MLLARMAEAVYWAGRYLERAECTARFVQVHTDAHVDMPVGEDVGWEPLLAIVGVDSEFAERHPSPADAGGADRASKPAGADRASKPAGADRASRAGRAGRATTLGAAEQDVVEFIL